MTRPLKPFQRGCVDELVAIIEDTAAKIVRVGAERRRIALAQGTALLTAPTGSGKTLMLARAIEAGSEAASAGIVWFWFAPFTGIVAQTRETLMAEAPGLRLRDLSRDRAPDGSRGGDVFVLTWATVASAKKAARRARQDGESLPSVDSLVEDLRDRGFLIGAVIDEAHTHFSAGTQAMAFYANILQPDMTLLATATPDDGEFRRFAKNAGISNFNRVTISRQQAVDARLNKRGIVSVYFDPSERDARLLDMDEVAMLVGLRRHQAIAEELAARDIPVTPLMLVQVDSTDGSVERARKFLIDQGVPEDAIATHTAKEPDPALHTIAYDDRKQVLIFKLAVATGFDAPRAWTLVSLRRARDRDFGLQIIGRIMRVHPFLQNRGGLPPLLETGHVFLARREGQSGLREAAEDIQHLSQDIRRVTDDVRIVRIGGGQAVLTDPGQGFTEVLDPPSSKASEAWPAEEDDADAPEQTETTPRLREQAALFALEQQEQSLRRPAPRPSRGSQTYRLRRDLGIPESLKREVPRLNAEAAVACIARRIDFNDSTIALVQRVTGSVTISEEDLIAHSVDRDVERFPLSDSRIAQAAQGTLALNDQISTRPLKRALVDRLRRDMEMRGLDIPPDDILRRVVNLALVERPYLLREALNACRAEQIAVEQAEPLPDAMPGPPALEPAERAAYGVFPKDLNSWEARLARLLDADMTGTVKWWLRNVDRQPWAVSIVLPTGRRFFPDFVVGVESRPRADNITLTEVKGRYETEDSIYKARTGHQVYGPAVMVHYQERDQSWVRIGYFDSLRRTQPAEDFKVETLLDP